MITVENQLGKINFSEKQFYSKKNKFFYNIFDKLVNKLGFTDKEALNAIEQIKIELEK